MPTRDAPWALILTDGKPGHENQSMGVVPPHLTPWCFRVVYHHCSARYRAWAAARLSWATPLAGRFPWHGLIRDATTLAQRIAHPPPQVVISSGSGPAPITLLAGRALGIPTVTCMTPSVGTDRFSLALVPRHDNPPDAANIVTTIGAPNCIDPNQLSPEGDAFFARHRLGPGPFIALLIGGDSPRFSIGPALAERLFDDALSLSRRYGAKLLVSTSRRTSEPSEARLKARSAEVAFFCAGRTDPERVVAGMLALSDLVVVTEDSISMVSEAASSGCRVVAAGVTRVGRPARRHEAVLNALEGGQFIRRAVPGEVAAVGADLLVLPEPPLLDDSARCRDAVARLLVPAP